MEENAEQRIQIQKVSDQVAYLEQYSRNQKLKYMVFLSMNEKEENCKEIVVEIAKQLVELSRIEYSVEVNVSYRLDSNFFKNILKKTAISQVKLLLLILTLIFLNTLSRLMII